EPQRGDRSAICRPVGALARGVAPLTRGSRPGLLTTAPSGLRPSARKPFSPDFHSTFTFFERCVVIEARHRLPERIEPFFILRVRPSRSGVIPAVFPQEDPVNDRLRMQPGKPITLAI